MNWRQREGGGACGVEQLLVSSYRKADGQRGGDLEDNCQHPASQRRLDEPLKHEKSPTAPSHARTYPAGF